MAGILDEATSALDEKLEAEIYRMLSQVLASHDHRLKTDGLLTTLDLPPGHARGHGHPVTSGRRASGLPPHG
jgi:hypothetical protein